MGQFVLTPMSAQMIQKIIVMQMQTAKTLMADFYVAARNRLKKIESIKNKKLTTRRSESHFKTKIRMVMSEMG